MSVVVTGVVVDGDARACPLSEYALAVRAVVVRFEAVELARAERSPVVDRFAAERELREALELVRSLCRDGCEPLDASVDLDRVRASLACDVRLQ